MEVKPLVLLMHHKAPHRNWMPALRHTRKFEDSEFFVPESYFDDYEGRRAAAAQEMNIYRDMHEGHDLKMTVAAGSSTSAMVMNIDFAPTFLELAGLESPADIQGRSLTEILEGHGPQDWRQSIYYHYYEYPGVHSVKRHYGVRNDRYKLIHFYHDIDAWEFYDLETDPLEMHNAIDDPDYRDEIEAMRAELQRLRAQYEVPPDE